MKRNYVRSRPENRKNYRPVCEWCKVEYPAATPWARFCSNKCRLACRRARVQAEQMEAERVKQQKEHEALKAFRAAPDGAKRKK